VKKLRQCHQTRKVHQAAAVKTNQSKALLLFNPTDNLPKRGSPLGARQFGTFLLVQSAVRAELILGRGRVALVLAKV